MTPGRYNQAEVEGGKLHAAEVDRSCHGEELTCPAVRPACTAVHEWRPPRPGEPPHEQSANAGAQAAAAEQLAGLLAHELAHVALDRGRALRSLLIAAWCTFSSIGPVSNWVAAHAAVGLGPAGGGGAAIAGLTGLPVPAVSAALAGA